MTRRPDPEIVINLEDGGGKEASAQLRRGSRSASAMPRWPDGESPAGAPRSRSAIMFPVFVLRTPRQRGIAAP